MGFLFDFNYCCKKSRDYGPRGKSLLYYIPHIPDIPRIPHIPDIPDIPDIPRIPHIPDIPDIPHIPHIPDIPEIFDLGISSQTGFFLGGGFCTFFLGGVFGTTWANPPTPYTTGTLQCEEQKIPVSCRKFNFMNKMSENRIRFKVRLRFVR